MTPQEIAQAGRDALIEARIALVARFKASTDAAERAQITDSVDAIGGLILEIDLADLLSAATAVGNAAGELEKVVATVKQQPLGQAFQGVVDALNKLGDVRSQAHAVEALPKATDPAPTPNKPAPTPVPPPKPPAAGLPAINTSTDFSKLAAEYTAYYAACTVRDKFTANAAYYVQQIASKKATYSDVVGGLGIPWFFVGIVHGMEASFNFNTHLHNGDPLSARTVRVPAGHPTSGSPPFAWRESAIDALTMQKLDKVTDWSLARMLHLLEAYNGFGYRFKGLPSPYLWSFSNLYTKGKYVADGKFDPEAVSGQCGAGVILKVGKDSGAF